MEFADHQIASPSIPISYALNVIKAIFLRTESVNVEILIVSDGIKVVIAYNAIKTI